MKTTGTGSRTALAACLLALLAGNALSAANDAEGNGERVVENAYFSADGREQREPDRVSTRVIADSESRGRRSAKQEPAGQSKTGDAASASPNTDFWFYTADIELFADEDRDGYYHGIDLLFDADTIYTRADVFAVIYLSRDGGPWIEYAETEAFTIWGASSTDEYVVVTELLDGFPTGSYDVLIELFDTWDGSFVADLGPGNTSELSFLPLEDAVLDTPPVASQPVVVNRGGGGAFGWLSLLALASAAALRRRSRRRPRLSENGRSPAHERSA